MRAIPFSRQCKETEVVRELSSPRVFAGFNFDKEGAGDEQFSFVQVCFRRALDGDFAGSFEVDTVELDLKVIRRHPGVDLTSIAESAVVP